MNEQVEILTRVYAYVNRIKVYLAFKDIAGIWHVVNELSEYLVSVDCAPTKLALDTGCRCDLQDSPNAPADWHGENCPCYRPRQ